MYKKYRLFTVLLCGLFVIGGCSSEDFEPNESSNLVKAFPIESYSAEEMATLMYGRADQPTNNADSIEARGRLTLRQKFMEANQKKVSELAKASSRVVGQIDFRYNTAIIHYQSTDIDGTTPITLSGRLIWADPSTGSQIINNIFIGNHFTITDDKACPSNNIPYDGYFALTDGLVICADYLGYGLTKDRIHPYLCEAQTAKNVIDCVTAGIEYIKNLGVNIASLVKTYNIGYSQGGAVTLAVHYYLENHPDLMTQLNFMGSCCGDGPYDPPATFKYYLNSGNRISMPVVFPYILMGMKEGFPSSMGSINIEDYFTKEFNRVGVIDLLKTKKWSTDEMNSIIWSSTRDKMISNILSSDAYTTTSNLYTSLMQALDANNLTKWSWPTLTRKIWFFHSDHDTVVPYDNLTSVKNLFGENNAKVSYNTSSTGKDHVDSGTDFYVELFKSAFLTDTFTGQ